MTAFEIYVNGRKRCVAGINGAGVVVSAITWCAGTTRQRGEDLEFRVSGLVSRTRTHVDWFHQALVAGDEVRIVMTKKARVDRPVKKRRESAAARKKRERAYIEKKAAEYGWRIEK